MKDYIYLVNGALKKVPIGMQVRKEQPTPPERIVLYIIQTVHAHYQLSKNFFDEKNIRSVFKNQKKTEMHAFWIICKISKNYLNQYFWLTIDYRDIFDYSDELYNYIRPKASGISRTYEFKKEYGKILDHLIQETYVFLECEASPETPFQRSHEHTEYVRGFEKLFHTHVSLLSNTETLEYDASYNPEKTLSNSGTSSWTDFQKDLNMLRLKDLDSDLTIADFKKENPSPG